MTDREIMQQALMALEEGLTSNQWRDLITALRERLAQPEQDVPATCFGNIEPVGWLESPDGAFRANPLYKIKFPSKLLSWQVSLYTSPQQREWQRLTDKEREEATGWSVEHIEAKLKEKNT